MSEATWTIAPLELSDCDELGRVHVQVWREAYAGLMPADHLAGLSADRSADRWRTIASGANRATGGSTVASTTLVARDAAGSIVGFASAGPSRDDDAPTTWELYVVNLLAEVHGTGLADELVGRVLGDRDATLWVVEENARARAFYARHGFVLEGGRSQDDATPEVRMVRRP